MVWERREDTKARRTELIGQEGLPVVRVDLNGRCPVVDWPPAVRVSSPPDEACKSGLRDRWQGCCRGDI